MKFIKNNFPLILIFCLALYLRFYNLSDFRCLNWDETSFGYNAYSILKTGRDEYGTLLPVQMKSVGDYKAPLYSYLATIPIFFFGLDEFSIRFVPSLLGSLFIIIFYYLFYKLTTNRFLSLTSCFLLSISPWHIQFTKGGADVAVYSFFMLLGMLGLIMWIKGNLKGIYLASIGFSLSIYSYYAPRIFIPAFFLLFLVFFNKNTLSMKGKKIFLLLTTLLLIPFFNSILFSSGHNEKLLKTSVLGYRAPEEYTQTLKALSYSSASYYLFSSQTFDLLLGMINRYFNHFSFSYLFFDGVYFDPRQAIYGMGLMYLFQIPLLLFGIKKVFKESRQTKLILLAWILAAPVPSMITRDEVSGRRAFELLFPLTILSSYGFLYLYDFFSKKNTLVKTLATLLSLGFVLWCMLFFVMSYDVFSKNRSVKGPSGWNCGYKELVDYFNKNKFEKNVIVDTLYQGPYIYFLFYGNYQPHKYHYQARLIQDSWNSLGEGKGFDNFEFRKVYWPTDRFKKCTIFAGSPERIPLKDIDLKEVNLLKTLYFDDKEVSFYIVETQGCN